VNLNSDIQAIAEIRERTMQAENDGDADFVKSVCTEDIVVMPPGMQAVSGRSAALGFMHGFLEQFDLQILYVSAEIQIDGDIAYDRGTYSQHLAAKDGGTVATENGNYLWIYRRAADGTWKMARIIWNAIGPSPK
jgi:uncharacterized protein (TIGR02246 family)